MDKQLQKPYDIKDRLFEFACDVINAYPRHARLDLASVRMWGQVLSSSTSSGAHLEEAQAGGSPAHFISLTRGGLREMRESNYWLRVMVATKLANYEVLGPLVQESHELKKILSTIVTNAVANAEKKKRRQART
ncbi:MAG: four helix bundle protein [Vicinamibacterales bacterium]